MTATSSMIRQLVERYHQLGLVALPVQGKRPVSLALDDLGRPLRREDGRPVRWQPFVERFPTETELDSFEWHRATGLAIVLGPATWQGWPYLWVLDIEAEHRETAERWLEAHLPGWRDGAVVETGGGGLHVYLLASRTVETRRVAWGEVRGKGTVCVLPPSRHPETSRPYRWLSEHWTNLPSLEPELVPGYPTQGSSAGNGRTHEPLDVPSALAGVPLGQRNTTLFRLACKLRGLGLPQDWTLKLVSEAAGNCTPQWGSAPDEEPVERLVARVYAMYQPNPDLVTTNGKHEFVSSPRGDEREETNSVPDCWRPVALSDLDDDSTSVEWIWDGFLAKGHLTDFYALWKSGKTTLLATLLQRMEHGGELAGRTVRPGKVLVITEEPKTKWAERREALGLGDHVALVSRPFPKRPNHAEWLTFASYIATLVAEQEYGLVVFDALPNLWPVRDENDASETVSALLPLQAIANAGAAVLIVRHPRKSDGSQGTAGRGSGAIAGFVDVIIEMRRYEPEQQQDTRRVLSVYSRYEPFEVVIRWAGDGQYETLGTPATYSAEAQRQRLLDVLIELDGATTNDLAKAVELPYATVSKRLGELEAAGQVIRTGTGKRGDPYRWSLASDDDPSDGSDFFSSRYTPKREEKKIDPGKPNISDGQAKNGEHDLAGKTEHDPGKPNISDDDAKTAICEQCGNPFAWSGRGKPARYCSDACRMKATRQRQYPQTGQLVNALTDGGGPMENLADVLLTTGDRVGWPLYAHRLAELASAPWHEAEPVLQALLDSGTLVALHGDRRVMTHTILARPGCRGGALMTRTLEDSDGHVEAR
ncbi:MAG: AAA family ATPase [Thermomicrobium sp.]|nr:AAA family ATPase [Thermomicrobium sp.]MDW8007389.1 AAA family ATPase [Thermomicrobium sp.]